MNKNEVNNKEQLLSLLRSRLERSSDLEISSDDKITDHQLAVLLSDLQIFQLELEMQNDELTTSHQLLEMERSRFAGLFNLAPVGYFIVDKMGMVEEANQTGADLLHISKSDILNKRLQSFIAPEIWDHFYAFLHQMQTATEKQSCEIKLVLINGNEIYTRMEGIAILNTQTSQSQYYITIIDISESRIAQQKLIDTTQRLEMTLNASGTGTWTMDLSANKVFLDDFSLSLLEIKPWNFDGSTRRFIEFIHPDDRGAFAQTLSDAIRNREELDIEFRIITEHSFIKTISAKGQEVSGGAGGNYFAGIVMDVTERKRLRSEAEIMQQEQQRLILSATLKAQEKERNKISNALHDSVCQILYGIGLNLQNIRHDGAFKNEFGNIKQLLDRAVREIRELSYELTPSVLRDFGFIAGVNEMAQRLSTPAFQIKTSLKVSVDSFSQEVQLYLFRIIQELINNCIKHANGTEAEIKMYKKKEWINLQISDNGQGFNLEKSLARGSGIRGIKNRMFLLKGEMNVKTSSNGTIISIKFKVDQESLTNMST